MGRGAYQITLGLAASAWLLGSAAAPPALRATAVPAARAHPSALIPDQAIVQFRSGIDGPTMERALHAAGGARARRSAFGPRSLVTLDAGFTLDLSLERLRSMPEVEYAEPNGRVWALRRPSDRLFRYQWHMQMLNAERTWDIQTGDPEVVVAVLDTGIAYEDFGPYRKAPDWGNTVFVPGLNVLTGNSHANDDSFHGTHVASAIAEATDNGEGAAGLAFECALMPVKILDWAGDGSFFDLAEGIDFAVSHASGRPRVRVINLSLGSTGESETVRRAIDRALSAGIVVVASAGNDGRGRVTFPAVLPGVIAVGAVDALKHRPPYSNFGPALDVVAPGGDFYRDDNGDGEVDGILQQTFDPFAAARGRFDDFGYFYAEGTSHAAPQVAALAALLVRQGITDPAAVQAAIESTAEDLGPPGRDDEYGHGLIQPSQALTGLGLDR